MTLGEAWVSAWEFAAHAHREQKVPGTGLPYLVHLGTVALEVMAAHQQRPLERPSLAIQCAILHDTLEDTATEESEIVSRFGPEVAAGVRALTKDETLPKADAMADSLQRIRAQSRDVWAVKLADRIANLKKPPPHWSADKIASYRVEAQTILAALGEGHEVLAARLARRIAEYPPG